MQTWVEAVMSQKWEGSERAALTRAGETSEVVLAAFTGVPWCGPCTSLEQEVFPTWTFLSWALGKVVLWNINDSSQGSGAPPECAKYAVSGYPSVLGLDAQGNELGRVLGYTSGTGAQLWIDSFESAIGWT
jgi:hypothetical protein